MGATPSLITGISVTSTYDGLSVMLSWDASVDGVTGYNIYRSSVPWGGTDDYYAKLNASPIDGLTYFDEPSIRFYGMYYYRVNAQNIYGEGQLSDAYGLSPYAAFDIEPILSPDWESLIF